MFHAQMLEQVWVGPSNMDSSLNIKLGTSAEGPMPPHHRSLHSHMYQLPSTGKKGLFLYLM